MSIACSQIKFMSSQKTLVMEKYYIAKIIYNFDLNHTFKIKIFFSGKKFSTIINFVSFFGKN